jgi:hypothetical protein
MYHEANKGWTADTNIMSKFGLQIGNEIVLVVSKLSWDIEIASYTQLHTMKTDGYRPQEGDLIYEPVTKSLLEIKFVKDTNSDFFQMGKVYQYQLTCEFFSYDSASINTGVPEIDAFMSNNSLDILDHQVRTEDDDVIVYEDCGYMVYEEIDAIVDQDERRFGTDFKDESLNISFDANNPFGEM